MRKLIATESMGFMRREGVMYEVGWEFRKRHERGHRRRDGCWEGRGNCNGMYDGGYRSHEALCMALHRFFLVFS